MPNYRQERGIQVITKHDSVTKTNSELMQEQLDRLSIIVAEQAGKIAELTSRIEYLEKTNASAKPPLSR